MKLVINRETLVKSVQDVLKAISTKTTIPVLTGIKIETTNEGVTLKGSDSDISIVTFIPLVEEETTLVEVERVGSVVIQAKLFSEIIKKLPNDQVSLEVNENLVTTVRSGKAEYNINGIDPFEYPNFPEVEDNKTIQLSQKAVKEIIHATIFAAADSEARPVLTGVCWQFEEGVLCTATDSHRLTNKKIAASTEGLEDLKVVIPKKSLNEISKLLDDTEELVQIYFTNNQVLFKLKNTSIYSRLLEGNYPDTSRLIPTDSKTSVRLQKREFLDAIERASLLAKDTHNHVIKFLTNSDGTIQVSSNSPELGKVEEIIEASSIEGEEITISFSAKYMKDALKALVGVDEIVIYFTGAMRPFVMKPVDDNTALQLILPVRTY